MLTLNYEYKLKLNRKQVLEVENILTVCRQVWNYALKERKDWCNSRKSPINSCSIVQEYILSADEPFPNYSQQAKRLTQARKTNLQLQDVHSQVLQQTLMTLDRAWNDMFNRGFGFPRYKKRVKSFLFPQIADNAIRENCLKLPQLGWVKFRRSREIPYGFVIKQARIVKKPSGYFVILAIQLDVNVPEVPIVDGHSLGIDIGLQSYLATSEGELIDRPKFFQSLQGKLRLLQRRLKNKTKGSNNWLKLQKKIARVHQQIANARKDFHFKLSHHLCQGAKLIFVEDIDFKAWAKGMLGKHTLDAGFGQFFNILAYISWKKDVFFAKVDKDYTSQTCPNCGCHTGKKLLKERIHHCSECGYKTHRDVAAAQVIKSRGLCAVGLPVQKIAFGGDASGAIPPIGGMV